MKRMRSGFPGAPQGARGLGAAALVVALALAGPGRAAITGVCPDGSVFIVQSREAIPCRDAKEMEPHDVPPLRPEYLPRPYTWEVYEQQGDPNNPYNLIDAAERVRALREARESAPRLEAAPVGQEAASVRRPLGPRPLGLSERELQDLHQIVELSQARAPARFVRSTADGRELLTIRFAASEAVAARLGLPGPVLLFSAVARAGLTLRDEFTFVQGHLAFHPALDDPGQMGVLQGALGPLEPGSVVLGYVVLPAEMDLAAPMDVYWNDRRISVTFRPLPDRG